jgi:hypothetical protein
MTDAQFRDELLQALAEYLDPLETRLDLLASDVAHALGRDAGEDDVEPQPVFRIVRG